MAKKTKLTEENYFSKEMLNKYQSMSQIKAFLKCEASALAELKGEYERKPSEALLQGSLLDVLLTGTESEYKAFLEAHPEIISTRGESKGKPKQSFQKIYKMYERVKQDELFMKTLSGEHQVIMEGKISGVPIKIKVDSLLPNAIVDLKTCESFNKVYYKDGQRVSFVEYFDYITQACLYREIVYQNTKKKLPFFLSCVSKEEEPDIAIFQIDDEIMDSRMSELNEVVPMIEAIKKGEVEPQGCGKCAYCRSKKKLTTPINWRDIELGD